MIMSNLKNLWKHRNTVLIAALLAALSFNLFNTQKKLKFLIEKSKTKPFIFIGAQFKGLTDSLEGLEKIGYYTDRSLDEKFAAAQFAQAQYMLIPTILDLNNTNYPFVIFDFIDKSESIENIKQLNMIPVSISPSGIILAKNPKFK